MTANLVRLNVLGFSLSSIEIDSVLDLQNQDQFVSNQRRWLANFFSIKESELTKSILSRYAEADAKMTRISIGSYQEDIHPRLIDTLASAKRSYAYGEFLACVELCALHGEMLANFLCITSKSILLNECVINQLNSKDQKTIQEHSEEIFFSDELNQKLRLRWLEKGKIITSEDSVCMIKVHELRKLYFHRWSNISKPINEEALNSLSLISQVSAKYLELLGNKPRTWNDSNLNRLKQYLEIIEEATLTEPS